MVDQKSCTVHANSSSDEAPYGLEEVLSLYTTPLILSLVGALTRGELIDPTDSTLNARPTVLILNKCNRCNPDVG